MITQGWWAYRRPDDFLPGDTLGGVSRPTEDAAFLSIRRQLKEIQRQNIESEVKAKIQHTGQQK